MTYLDKLTPLVNKPMGDYLEHTFLLHEKIVTIRVCFDLYKEEQYLLDLREVMGRQVGYSDKELSDKKLLNQITLGLIASKWMEKKHQTSLVNYSQFREISSSVVFDAIVKFLHTFPEIILKAKQEYSLNFWIDREPGMPYDGVFFEEHSSKEKSVFAFIGGWLIWSVILPTYYFKFSNKIVSERCIYKYLVHEFRHAIEDIDRKFAKQDEIESAFKWYDSRNKFGMLKQQALFFETLRAEATAEFSDKMDANFYGSNKLVKTATERGYAIEFSKEGIFNFKKAIQKLSQAKNSDQAEKIYSKYIDPTGLDDDELNKLEAKGYQYKYHLHRSGVYPMSRLMCYTIALAIQLESDRKHFENYQMFHNKKTAYALKDFSKCLHESNESELIFVRALDQSILKKSLDIITQKNWQDFIKLYEKACDIFEIKEEDRIITWKLVEDTSSYALKVWNANFGNTIKSKKETAKTFKFR